MSTHDPQIHTLTGAYALDALPDDEREAFEAHLAGCEPCAQEVAELLAAASHLGGLLRELPPERLRDAVMAEIAGTPQEPGTPTVGATPGPPLAPVPPDGRDDAAGAASAPPGPPPAPRPRDGGEVVDLGAARDRTVPRWIAWTGAAAASVAAIAAVAMGVQLAEVSQELDEAGERLDQASQELDRTTEELDQLAQQLDRADEELAEVRTVRAHLETLLTASDVQMLAVTAEDGTEARLVVSVERGQAMLFSTDMEPAPHAHTYEAWVIDENGPTSIGLFDADDDGRVSVLVEGRFEGAAAIGVTIEPEGGSPEPTTDPVMLLPLEG